MTINGADNQGASRTNIFTNKIVRAALGLVAPKTKGEQVKEANTEDNLCDVSGAETPKKTANISLKDVAIGEYAGIFAGSRGDNYDIALKESIPQMMDFITKDNIDVVLTEYGKIDQNGLIDAIFESEDYTKREKVDFAFHILKCKEERALEKGCYEACNMLQEARLDIGLQDENDTDILDSTVINRVLKDVRIKEEETLAKGIHSGGETFNGKIDADFSQGEIGDCWLLASVKSIASTPKGLEILNDSVKVLDANTVEVTLKGAGKTYAVTKDEIEERALTYSDGDGDVMAIEIAMDKYFSEENIGYNSTIEDGGWGHYAYRALLGDGGNQRLVTMFEGENINHITRQSQFNKIIEKVKEPNFICTMSAHSPEVPNSNDVTPTGISALDEGGNKVDIVYNHAYSVLNSDEDYVYVVNPWNTSSTLKLTHDDFASAFNYASMYDLS